MNNPSLFDMLKPEQHALDTLATLKEGLPTGDELFNALRGHSEDYGRYFLRAIQKRLEILEEVNSNVR